MKISDTPGRWALAFGSDCEKRFAELSSDLVTHLPAIWPFRSEKNFPTKEYVIKCARKIDELQKSRLPKIIATFSWAIFFAYCIYCSRNNDNEDSKKPGGGRSWKETAEVITFSCTVLIAGISVMVVLNNWSWQFKYAEWIREAIQYSVPRN